MASSDFLMGLSSGKVCHSAAVTEPIGKGKLVAAKNDLTTSGSAQNEVGKQRGSPLLVAISFLPATVISKGLLPGPQIGRSLAGDCLRFPQIKSPG